MGEETFLPDKDGKNVTFVEKLMLLFMEIFFLFAVLASDQGPHLYQASTQQLNYIPNPYPTYCDCFSTSCHHPGAYLKELGR